MYRTVTYSVGDPKMFSSILFLFFLFLLLLITQQLVLYVGRRKESQEDKKITTNFDVEKFSRVTFGLQKLKMVNKDCGKWTDIVEDLKSFSDDAQQQRQGEHKQQFRIWELTRLTLKMEKTPSRKHKKYDKQHKKTIRKTNYKE